MKKSAFFIFAILFISNNLFGQDPNNNITPNEKIFPPSPTASSLGKYGEIPVSYYTGTPEIGIPIYEIKTKSLSLPMSLSYHASGLKVEEQASWVGFKFSLNCGGVITRSVVGKPDDHGGGYMEMYSMINSGVPFGDVFNEGFCNDNGFDTEPDVFYYNFNGKSGRIIYAGPLGFIASPAANIKFEPFFFTGEITGWNVFTEDGTHYFFGNTNVSSDAIEKTFGSDFTCRSSWYVSNISEANGSGEINFIYNSYTDPNNRVVLNVAASQTLETQIGGEFTSMNSNKSNFSSRSNTYVNTICYLEKIIFENYEIEFIKSSRNDIANDKKLDAIKIKRNNLLLKQVNFNYSYFNSTRLKLDNITFCNNQNTDCNLYSFTYYNQHSLPSTVSMAQDHWGFYNGQNTNYSMIPQNLVHPLSDFANGANRDPSSDLDVITAGLLNKIIYPTGGNTEFFYEPNIVYNNPIVNPIEYENTNVNTNVTYDSENNPQNLSILNQNSFIVNLAQDITINTNFTVQHTPITNPQWSLLDPDDYPVCYVRIKNLSGNIIQGSQESARANMDGSFNITCHLLPGTYTLETELTTSGWPILSSPNRINIYAHSQVEYIFDHQLPGVNLTYLCGGVRIQKIIDQDNNGNNHIRKFEYLFDNGSVSGKLLTWPIYSYVYTLLEVIPGVWCNYTTYHFLELSSRSLSFTGSNQGSHVGYSQVTEFNGELGEAGKTVYNYTNTSQVGMGVPFAPARNDNFKGGLLTRKKIFKKDISGSFISVYELQQDYNFYQNNGDPNRIITKGYKVQYRRKGFTCSSWTSNQYYSAYYDVISEWFYLKSKTEYNYDENGLNPVVQTHNYFYENPAHMQMTKKSTNNSDGTLNITQLKYPQDFDLTIASTDPTILALKAMVSPKHIKGLPIEKIEKKFVGGVESILSAGFTTYNVSAQNYILPKKVYSLQTISPILSSSFTSSYLSSTGFIFDSHYRPSLNYDSYDKYGNILGLHKENDIQTSYQWDLNGFNPIASFTNAIYKDSVVGNECSFSGFETLGNADDNWSGTIISDQTQSHTGNWSANVSTGNQLSHDFYPDHQNQRYRLSCWVKFPTGYNSTNGSLIINAKSSLTGSPLSESQPVSFTGIANEWSYQEVILDLESIHNNLGNNNNFWIGCIIKNTDPLTVNVDDIRFEPIPCETKTITYDPLFDQVSSISDQNSLPQYFDYDNFGRLQYISDLNRKVLKKYDYHYKDPGNANDYNKVSETNFHLPFTASQVNSNVPAWNDFNRTNSYLDGSGRLIQTVNEKQSPDAQDIIVPIVYDQFGRTPKNYLPYSINSNNGSFDANTFSGTNNLNSFYQSVAFVAHTTYPFAESVFEASPLNRVDTQGAPGSEWQIATNHTIKTQNNSNSWNEGVFQWKVDLSSGFPTGAYSQQLYSENSLFKKILTDEEGKQSFEYTDKLGRLIAKGKNVKVDQSTGETFDFSGGQNSTCSSCITVTVITYYIYDDFGRLAYVVPQGALTDLKATNETFFTESDPIFNRWIYGYHYDEKGRQTEKKIPGESWEYFIYNNIDNLIMSQNGNERLAGSWKCFKYDALHRNIISGYSLSYPGTRQYIKTIAENLNATNVNYERITFQSPSSFNYSLNAFPTVTEFFTINYYDGYDYESQVPVGSPYAAPSAKSVHTNGLLTGNLTRLNPDVTPATYLLDKNYYDDKSRVIETHKQHQLGGWDKYNNQYDFVGQLTASTRLHTSSQHAAITIATQNVYDHAGRLIDILKQIDADPQILMVHNDYNKLGQLITKKLHNTSSTNFLQTIDYRYNIRGWLTSINNSTITNDGGVKNTDAEDAFGEEILYNDVSEISTGLNNLVPIGKYDGNISSVKWKFRSPSSGLTNVTTPVRAYMYRYDDLNRMTAGYYCENSASDQSHFNSSPHFFDETLRFDAMGNIKRLDRMYKGTSIDALVYSYTGNQATGIHDNITQVYSRGFKDGTNTNADYEYDSNGNQKTDRNKGLSLLYNLFNLPLTVTSSNGTAINYLYDGMQGKRQKTFNGSTRNYIDGIEYENGLQFISTEEGRIRPRSSFTYSPATQYVYDYFIKDHLGNIRAVVTNEIQSRSYFATMESTNATAEEALFYNINSTRINIPTNYPNDQTTPTNLQVSGLNAGTGKVFGPAKVLGIMEGDRVDINTKYFFVGGQMAGSGPVNPPDETKFPIEVFLDDSDIDIPPPPDGGTTSPSNVQLVNDLLTQLAIVFTISVSTISGGEINQAGATAAFGANSNLATFLVSAFNNAITNYPNNPRAFLIYLFFNKDFVFNPLVSGALQTIIPDQLGNLAVTNVKFPENGYLYVYVCNETAMDVNFDNLQIIHYTNPLTEVNDYYPFGLLAKTSTSLGGTPQNYKYNGKELQKDLAFNVLDYGARQYDPVNGRWLQVDPSVEDDNEWSPYNYVRNNPITHNDPDGRFWNYVIGAVAGAVAEYGGQVIANSVRDGFRVENFYQDIDYGDIGLSAAEGALTSGGSVIKGLAKGAVVVGSEVMINTVDVTSDGVEINTTGNVIKNTAIGLTLGKIGNAAPAPKVKVVNAPTPKQAVKQARQEAKASGTVVNREKRVATETKAKSNQTKAKGANEAAGKTAQNSAASGTSESTKRATDEKKGK